MFRMSGQRSDTIHTDSAAATEQIGETIGGRIRGGEVIELVSDLGGGKTTLVRGLVRGLGSHDRVASPTFTISREYSGGRHAVYHFDFYRLHDAGVVGAELSEVAHDPDAVTLVEWGDIVRDVLPARKLQIDIRATGEETRELVFSYPPALAYLIPAKEQQ